MRFQDLLTKLSDNIKSQDEKISDVVTQSQDRIKMMNPEVQGPKLAESTPEEDQYYQDVASAVAGAVAPVKKAAPLVETGENYFSKQIPNVVDKLNTVADAFGPYSQSSKSTAQDLARKLYQEERERMYRQQKLNALKKLSK